MEFAVQMTCQKCVNAINNSLQGVEGELAFYKDLQRNRKSQLMERDAPEPLGLLLSVCNSRQARAVCLCCLVSTMVQTGTKVYFASYVSTIVWYT